MTLTDPLGSDVYRLTAVPEPSSALLLGLAALATIVCVPRVRRGAAAGVRRGSRSAGVCTGVLLALAMLGTRTGFLRFVRAGCLVAFVLGWGASVSQAQIWVGATEDWGTASNWLPGFPPPGANVAFGAAGVKTVDFGDTTRIVNNFAIASDADYFFDNGTLQISGDFTSSGSSGSHTFESNHYTTAIPMFEPSNQTLFGVNSNHTFTISDTVSFSDLGLAAGASNVSLTKAGGGTMIVRQRINVDGDIDIDSGVLDLRGGSGGDTPASSAGNVDLFTGSLLVSGAATFTSLEALAGTTLKMTNADVDLTDNGISLEVWGITSITDTKLTAAVSSTIINRGLMTVAGGGSDLLVQRFNTLADGVTTIENGARVDTTSGAFVHVGAVTNETGTATLNVNSDGLLTTRAIRIGEEADVNGDVFVSNADLWADVMDLGGNRFNGSGGTGRLVVEDQGEVIIGSETRLWSSASSISVDDATFSTGTLNNEPRVNATISISDPAGASALTIGIDDGNSEFDGLITDATSAPGSITKVGAGTLALSNSANDYSGGTIIQGGVVSISDDAALGAANAPITMDGGSLHAAAALSTARPVIVTSTGGSSGADITYSAAMSGSGSFNKAGAGAFAYTGSSLMPGEFNVDDGTLDFQSTTSISDLNVGTSDEFGFARATISSGADIGASKVTLGSAGAIGQLSITDGNLTSDSLLVGGVDSGAIGILNVEGAGASLADTSDWERMRVVRGSARIGDGASASTVFLDVGSPNTTGASVLVEGAGTTLEVSDSLNAGSTFLIGRGPGSFEIRDGAALTAPDIFIHPEGTFTLGTGAIANTDKVTFQGGGGGNFVWDGGTLNNTRAAGMTVADNTLNFVNGGGTYDFAGDLAIPATHSFDVNDATLIAATIDLDSSAFLNLTDATIDSPVTLAAGSATNVIGQVDFEQFVSGPGAFFGSGTANFNGGYAPGASPAAVPFEGNVGLDTDNTLFIELAGTGLGQFDALLIDGNAMLDGILDVSLLGYTPAGGEVFDIILADTIAGDFATINLPTLAGDLFWQTETITDPLGSDTYRLTAVPEPSSALLLGLGAVACIAYLRFGRRASIKSRFHSAHAT